MKHIYPPMAVIVIAIFFHSCSPLVHKGFKQLNADKKDLAGRTFEKASKDALQRPVATYGTYKISGGDLFRGDYRELEAAFIQVKKEKIAFNALPPDRKAYYAKKKAIKVTEKSFDNLLIRIQSKALERISDRDSLLLLDTFLVYMSPVFKRSKKTYENLEDTLVMHNMNSRHYNTLRSIAKNHLGVLTKQRLGINQSFRNRMWEAFLRDYPLADYRSYVEDFKADGGHEYCRDCNMNEFLRVVETRNLDTLVRFIDTARYTNMDETVAYGILYPVNQYLLDQLNGASPKVKNRVEELIRSSKWMEYGFPPIYSVEEVARLVKDQIQDTAPSNRSYWVLQRGLDYIHERKKYELELEVLQFGKPYFPGIADFIPCQRFVVTNKNQLWFEKVIQTLLKDAEHHQATYLGEPIEQEKTFDIAPIISVDDSTLYFASYNRSPQKSQFDIVKSVRKPNPGWVKPVIQRGISTKASDFPMGITADQDFLLTRRDTFLLISEWNYEKNLWSRPKPVLIPKLAGLKWIGNATLSRDGKVIIFEGSEDYRPIMNEENIDLYVMEYNDKDKEWGPAMNLGFGVNTSIFQERFPHLHVDGRTLLFATKGHYGFAWPDWFSSTRKDSTWTMWTIPENIGKEYNSYRVDWQRNISVPANGKKVYYSSSITPTKLEQIELPSYSKLPRYIVMKGKIPFQPKKGMVKAHNAFPLDIPILDSCKVLPKGKFNLLVPDQGQSKAYIYVDDPEVYSTYEIVEMEDIEDVITLTKNPKVLPFRTIIGKELPLPLKYATFGAFSTDLSPAFKQELRWVAHYFEQNNQTLLVGGYTFDEGSEMEQASLSLERAESVKSYLVELGLEGDRIWTQGFGNDYVKDKKINPSGEESKGRTIAIFLKKP